ncbi:MAG: HopJ type III effector protein [Cytophagaceae bacterium]|nr:HopJ type III effector protein [Cytophagaceae bacterium]MBK9508506.1 HopJ type III effector protein [Cytophagaceae bacterium]MBK9935475.1 HopJ type III effector protein [Cytophagaceae bacterium]MBL0301916.1 HopJ type III effector protein [Cytophagaceae bacterium]MBL0324743.1 HopJ type III effector protein [Cytophagaceae bacterium]
MSNLGVFLEKIKSNLKSISFDEVIAFIDEYYLFSPTMFKNGDQINDAGQNNGSCKIFYFSKINQLSESETLACFGKYYRIDVLNNPEGTDHQNIRNFMKFGWAGISFDGIALSLK